MENTIVPIIRTGQALQSLRDSGYSIETALSEVIDNSLEAGANNINVHLFKGTNSKGKKCVSHIAISDDGGGMPDGVLMYYPQIGYSSRYMREDTIGKYGVGAKLAALNFAKKFDVWSRNKKDSQWKHVYFDLEETLDLETKGIVPSLKEPKVKELPLDFMEILPGKTGTIVIWSKIDRLEEGRYAVSFDVLKQNLEKELARIFRYFINGGINIYVNGKKLLAHDPLYIMENTLADMILCEHYKKHGEQTKGIDHFASQLIADEEVEIGPASARLRVTLYPKEVTRKRLQGGDELARKLRVPENQGSISFVRMNREVSYTNVPRILPSGVKDSDRFFGIEISFSPVLDSYFGVRNVKRGVEPHGELRHAIRERLKRHIKTARKLLKDAWGAVDREENYGQGDHNDVVETLKELNSTLPKGRATGPESEQKSNQILADLARDVIGSEDVVAQKEYREKIKDLPIVVESIDFPGTQFIDIIHLADQIIIRMNTRHRFYRALWIPLKQLSETEQEDIDLASINEIVKTCLDTLSFMVMAYGKAESMNEDPESNYRDLTGYWGQFLDTMLAKINIP